MSVSDQMEKVREVLKIRIEKIMKSLYTGSSKIPRPGLDLKPITAAFESIDKRLLRLTSIVCLFICLVCSSLYILKDDPKGERISSGDMITNENEVVDFLGMIFNAQQKYHAIDWDEDGKNQYARFIAHLWQTVDKNADPVKSRFIPRELAFAMGKTRAFKGYYYLDIHYKGKQDVNTRSNMNPGLTDMDPEKEWVIIAVPAEYGHTGTLTFLVSSAGRIYAKDNEGRDFISIPESFIPPGWKEIRNKADIEDIRT